MTAVLHWRDFGADRPFHAALVPLAEAAPRGAMHSHADFLELVYVAAGRGTQRLASGAVQELSPGDLMLVRSHDTHDFATEDPDGCQLINVAFTGERWRAFVEYAAVAAAAAWETTEQPVVVRAAGAEVAEAMWRSLSAFQRAPRWLDLVALWAVAVPALESALAVPDDRPPWLVAATAAMFTEVNLAAGLPRLRALAAVSEGHLARTMSTYIGCSPVEFVNRVRLDHAANLLATTTESIGAVAARCGFGSHAYFCGRFQQRFGVSPGHYRSRARRAVVP